MFDCTVEVTNFMPVWPGNPAAAIKTKSSIENGDPTNVSSITIDSHTGTHVDAPYHLFDKGEKFFNLDISSWLGKAQVIQIENPKEVTSDEILKKYNGREEIVLFKTKNSGIWSKTDKFVENYVYINTNAAQKLVDLKIRLVGIDYLSVEEYNSSNAETHSRLLQNNVLIIEGLNLSKVHEGVYFMVCCPLKIHCADGSPARVVLFQDIDK